MRNTRKRVKNSASPIFHSRCQKRARFLKYIHTYTHFRSETILSVLKSNSDDLLSGIVPIG